MNPIHLLPIDFYNICFNTIPASKSKFSKLHLSLRFSPPKPVIMFFLPQVCHMPHPAHSPRLMTRIILEEGYAPHSPNRTVSPISCHSCPNKFPVTHFSVTLSLCSFLIIRYRVSHQYKTSVKTSLLFFINVVFSVGKQEGKRF